MFESERTLDKLPLSFSQTCFPTPETPCVQHMRTWAYSHLLPSKWHYKAQTFTGYSMPHLAYCLEIKWLGNNLPGGQGQVCLFMESMQQFRVVHTADQDSYCSWSPKDSSGAGGHSPKKPIFLNNPTWTVSKVPAGKCPLQESSYRQPTSY